ncbi:DUF3343 domain-containing protein [Tepidibacter formicigenes]|jgi:hypothetical protein|uniref:Putative Se/S carrier protein-like domain-containing protein n=1 Tax=Tepidibacter formicigenes DSM 15518 TaxID=1123349 RepID=A0A1M6P9I7_9FIRM|nr:DUF3343 domain-containing protein [Tepidibacter formicigenes]SHK04560.1 Protein of unknown function [Tepidibacter formicigenes DSM 15518]
MNNIYLVTFNSTHYAIRSEKVLKELNLPITIIPTPREISSSCGLSIKFEEKLLEDIKNNLEKNDIEYYGIFKITKTEDGKKETRKLY